MKTKEEIVDEIEQELDIPYGTEAIREFIEERKSEGNKLIPHQPKHQK